MKNSIEVEQAFMNTWTVSEYGVTPPQTFIKEMGKQANVPLNEHTFYSKAVIEFIAQQKKEMMEEGFTYNYVNFENETMRKVTLYQTNKGKVMVDHILGYDEETWEQVFKEYRMYVENIHQRIESRETIRSH